MSLNSYFMHSAVNSEVRIWFMIIYGQLYTNSVTVGISHAVKILSSENWVTDSVTLTYFFPDCVFSWPLMSQVVQAHSFCVHIHNTSYLFPCITFHLRGFPSLFFLPSISNKMRRLQWWNPNILEQWKILWQLLIRILKSAACKVF